MTAASRSRQLLQRALAVVRGDIRAWMAADHRVLAGLRYAVEVTAVVGLGLRQLCYVAAAVVMEDVRRGFDADGDVDVDSVPVFDSGGVAARWAWTGPGFEHPRQSRWEVRLAAVFCVVVGVGFYEMLAYFPLTVVERSLLWVTCGTLVVEPAWMHLYLGGTWAE